MITSERVRHSLAKFGCLLFLMSSFMPMFGGIAKHTVRCRGREFTGNFDDCFNDYLPILELVAPVFALLLLWPFARFAFSLLAPVPVLRTRRWRMASRSPSSTFWPHLHAVGALGAIWAVWRAATYPMDKVTAPYFAFWVTFAVWFVISVGAAVYDVRRSER